jgi:hypothetical protein
MANPVGGPFQDAPIGRGQRLEGSAKNLVAHHKGRRRGQVPQALGMFTKSRFATGTDVIDDGQGRGKGRWIQRASAQGRYGIGGDSSKSKFVHH